MYGFLVSNASFRFICHVHAVFCRSQGCVDFTPNPKLYHYASDTKTHSTHGLWQRNSASLTKTYPNSGNAALQSKCVLCRWPEMQHSLLWNAAYPNSGMLVARGGVRLHAMINKGRSNFYTLMTFIMNCNPQHPMLKEGSFECLVYIPIGRCYDRGGEISGEGGEDRIEEGIRRINIA